MTPEERIAVVLKNAAWWRREWQEGRQSEAFPEIVLADVLRPLEGRDEAMTG